MKKVISIILIFIMVLLVSVTKPLEVHADMGPKSSVTVDFKNLSTEVYVTLISRSKSSGPACVYNEEHDGSIEDAWMKYKGIISIEDFEKFINYEDVDGYFFLQTIWKVSNDKNSFSWGYYPPDEFKILVLYSNEGKFATSDRMTSYAFSSYFTVDMKDFSVSLDEETNELPEPRKSYDYFGEALAMTLRIILTISVELCIAMLFFSRKWKLFKIIAIVNIITQVILNVILNIIYYYHGGLTYLLMYIPLELLVILIEVVAYIIILKKSKEEVSSPVLKAIIYAVVANIVSFGIGVILSLFLPFGF